MTEFLNTTGVYTGNEFKGKGIISKGSRQGQEWQRYKAMFKTSMEAEKGFSFTCFNTLTAKNTKQLTDLIVGQSYKIVYSAEERINNNVNPPATYTSKTVVGFYSPEDQSGIPTQQISQVQQPMTATNNPISNATGTIPQANLNLSNFETFKNMYFNAATAKGLQPELVHMIGSYLGTYELERIQPLKTLCEQAINNIGGQKNV